LTAELSGSYAEMLQLIEQNKVVEGTLYRLYFARRYGSLCGLVEKLWEKAKA